MPIWKNLKEKGSVVEVILRFNLFIPKEVDDELAGTPTAGDVSRLAFKAIMDGIDDGFFTKESIEIWNENAELDLLDHIDIEYGIVKDENGDLDVAGDPFIDEAYAVFVKGQQTETDPLCAKGAENIDIKSHLRVKPAPDLMGPSLFIHFKGIPLWRSSKEDISELSFFLIGGEPDDLVPGEKEPYVLACRNQFDDINTYGWWHTIEDFMKWYENPTDLYRGAQ